MTDSENSVETGTSKVRTLTAKGKIYQVELMKDQMSSAQRAWRKQMNKVSNIIVDSSNVDVLKSERSFLETKMEILNATNERFYESLESDFDAKKEVMMKFESLEREHSETLRKINDRIQEIKHENGSERSRTSKRSSRTSQSSKSEQSSVASSLARKTAIAANVARLKTELEFADAEAQKTTALKEYEDELKRFKLTKELALAKAEMEAVIKTEISGNGELPQELDKGLVLENYLQRQASSVTNYADNLTVVTNVESSEEPFEESGPSNEAIPSVNNATETSPTNRNPGNEPICTPNQRPVIKTPNPLNPFSPEFEPRVFPRSEEPYYPAEVKPDECCYPRQDTEFVQKSDPPNTLIVEDSITRLADILSQRRLQDSLPLPEPEVFSGDLLQYPVWLKSFETIIERQTDKVSQRLYYLGKYTAGEPKEAISGLLLLETAEAYKQAKKILSDRFGHPFLVADAYRKKINEWPKIPPNDGTSLRKFSDFLIHCQTAMDTVRYLDILDDPDENQRIVRKRPRYLIDRWSREVDRWLNRDEDQRHSGVTLLEATGNETGYPPFSVFCRFLQRESRIACNPVTAVTERRSKQRRSKQSKKIL